MVRYVKLLVIAVMVLGGCQASSSLPKYHARNSLPRSKPDMVARSGSDLEDPWQAHLKARRRVNPRDTSVKRSYTQLVGDTVSQKRPRITSKDREAHDVPPVPSQKPIGQKVAFVQAPVTSVFPVPRSKPVMKVQKQIVSDVVRHHVTNMRIGDHPGKTRIVFDADVPIDADVEVRKGGRLVYLTFHDVGWKAHGSRSFADHRILSGYEALLSEAGVIVKILMKKPVKVSGPKRYPPNDKYQNHRISIDVI